MKTKEKEFDKDIIAGIAVRIVDKFVDEGLCPDCIDTDDSTEFQYQDIIRDYLEEVLISKPNEI